jgi:beta-aspartyl-peptidase (threonine type)
MSRFAIAVHGGAGLIRRDSLSPEREARCREGLLAAVEAGRRVLAAGGAALDAVEAAVVTLEDDPLFNAGRGAVLAAGGAVELDAAVMEGASRRAGAAGMITRAKNPVRLARAVMERTPHVLLVGPGADALVDEAGLEAADVSWFITDERRAQWASVAGAGVFQLDHGGARKDVYGTVGAVACDQAGHVAAATSTGGMVNKRRGRLGDSPIIGAGTYAWDATCAVSGTGHGEPFIRLGVAARVSAWMELGGLSLADAAAKVVHEELPALDGQGGLIAVDRHGRVVLPFNTGGMFRAWVCEGEEPEAAIW